MKNRYFRFLCDIVGKADTYGHLLETLHSMTFHAFVLNDYNRAEDGKQLRDKFCDREGNQALSFCPAGDCTVLEMLIGLSYRLEFETTLSRWEKTPDEWFWILIDNLGLDWCDNVAFNELHAESEVVKKVAIMVERDYDRDGNGGLFPLNHTKNDQRNVEIWYQMSEYILENYPM